ncbi:hypothetical protein BJ165DRAFT_752926 [Panaeolus papilionaceus]|nr:hypothetical protein BJ165DRAFT_752926 [Panaeolus papilionaceus]
MGTASEIIVHCVERVADHTRFQMIVCAGVSTSVVNAFLAILICVSLLQGVNTMPRTQKVIKFLVRCFLTTGLLTSFASLSSTLLSTLRPDTLLYLAVEIWIIQLYLNVILTLFNAKKILRKRMEETIELDVTSRLIFGGDDIDEVADRGNINAHAIEPTQTI